MLISSVIDLCGGGWWGWISLPSPPHPYCFRVWMFQFVVHRHLLWDWSPGKLLTLLSDEVSRDFSQQYSYFPWTQDIILWKIYPPPSRNWGHWYWVNGTVHLKLPPSYLSKLESDEWESVHILVATRSCEPWVKPHCVLLPMFGLVWGPTV